MSYHMKENVQHKILFSLQKKQTGKQAVLLECIKKNISFLYLNVCKSKLLVSENNLSSTANKQNLHTCFNCHKLNSLSTVCFAIKRVQI